ncbi:hypothetical protein AA313_de0203349 [Arthrobotrys entomopaga]|nr:hypothetical protein AA313_de0203349 [Arthrobotrys entomopaga]
MVSDRILSYFFFLSTCIVQAQAQSFLLNFEGEQFKDGKTTGRLNDAPIQNFDLGDFSVITAQEVPSGEVAIASLKTALLRPCSPNHYIVRIAQKIQDGTFDRGSAVGIKIAPNEQGAPSFKSFDATSICLGIAFIPAITQGMALPGPVGTDPFSQIVYPESGKITITGTKYQPPGPDTAQTVTTTVTFIANSAIDLADLENFHTTNMVRVMLPPTFTNLVLLQFKISGANVGGGLGLAGESNDLLQRLSGNAFESIAIDDFAGTKYPNT